MMEQSQFDTLMLAISGLKGEIVALDSKLSSRISELDSKLSSRIDGLDLKISTLDSKLDTQIAILRTGIAEINAQGREHERRIKRLEEENRNS